MAGELEQPVAELERQIAELEQQLELLKATRRTAAQDTNSDWPLSPDEYRRYGRQLILPEIGIHGQTRLKEASVLVIGAGGLGAPVLFYLAAAGVDKGTIGIIDGDLVDTSNLHRQIIYQERDVNKPKTKSAVKNLLAINSTVNYIDHDCRLSPQNAISIMEQYDLAVDCTDRPETRYLVSDTAVLTDKPVVFASAVGVQGQMMVFDRSFDGPCYRCIFPESPPEDSVQTCSDAGILGPVVGAMGVLQALEVIKYITCSGKKAGNQFLHFSPYDDNQWRRFRLRRRRDDCIACGKTPSLTALSLPTMQYGNVCRGKTYPDNKNRLDVGELEKLMQSGCHTIIDVRPTTQYEICHLPDTQNIPLIRKSALLKAATALLPEQQIIFICRYGNDSRLAVQMLVEAGFDSEKIFDVRGGIMEWAERIEPGFPIY